MNILSEYRKLIRKKIAELKLLETTTETIKQIAHYKARLQKTSQQLQQDFSLDRLISILEGLLGKEQDRTPSQTDKERWALKWAVLEYYKNLRLQVPGATRVIDNPASGKTIHQYAPNTDAIYALWTNKLKDLTKEDGVNNFDITRYDENLDRGTPRGGAFEKQLQRYRAEFIKEMVYGSV
jgi:hypothetical protein